MLVGTKFCIFGTIRKNETLAAAKNSHPKVFYRPILWDTSAFQVNAMPSLAEDAST